MPSRQLKHVVVVGAGVAGTRAAETLRQDGFDGALTIVGAERQAPYHRPPLSKKLLTGKVHRAGVDLAPQFGIDARVLRGASALKLDMSLRTVHVRDEDKELSLPFDGLVIASGAVPRATMRCDWFKGIANGRAAATQTHERGRVHGAAERRQPARTGTRRAAGYAPVT